MGNREEKEGSRSSLALSAQPPDSAPTLLPTALPFILIHPNPTLPQDSDLPESPRTPQYRRTTAPLMGSTPAHLRACALAAPPHAFGAG